MQIALLSDNHGYDGHDVLPHLDNVDEIWHAGDIGDLKSLDLLADYAPIRAVYGNIDDINIRSVYPLDQVWTAEGVKVVMTHIGNYPPKYYKRVRQILHREKPNLYICGHSHICKVIPDPHLSLLHMNPGSYGHHGFHQMRTFLRFTIQQGTIHDLRVIELGRRGRVHQEIKNTST